jgi:hypothetical protein
MTTTTKSRREFLKKVTLASLGLLLGCGSDKREKVVDANNSGIYEEYKQLLFEKDSFIADPSNKDLEGVFQREYNARADTELRLRSAPSIAQLNYSLIMSMLENNDITMLYPGGEQDIAPLLFGHLLHKQFPKTKFKAIYTEIDDVAPMAMNSQLDWLKKQGVLDYTLDGSKSGDLKTFSFEITTTTGKVMIEYRIRPPSKNYYTAEDAAEANLFRENFTLDGANDQEFIARIIKKGKTSHGKPIIVMFPDYSNLGVDYRINMDQGYDSATDSYIMPDRFISRKELVALEDKLGHRGQIIIADENELKVINRETGHLPHSTERPLRDIPGQFFLSRGYSACSCNTHMNNLNRVDNISEPKRYDYVTVYKPHNVEDMLVNELAKKLRTAFGDDNNVQVFNM